jgi:hypothetical protein
MPLTHWWFYRRFKEKGYIKDEVREDGSGG